MRSIRCCLKAQNRSTPPIPQACLTVKACLRVFGTGMGACHRTIVCPSSSYSTSGFGDGVSDRESLRKGLEPLISELQQDLPANALCHDLDCCSSPHVVVRFSLSSLPESPHTTALVLDFRSTPTHEWANGSRRSRSCSSSRRHFIFSLRALCFDILRQPADRDRST